MRIINLQKEREKKLGNKVKDSYHQPRTQETPEYLRTRGAEYKGVLEKPVFMSFLPHGDGWEVYGEFDPRTHTITWGNDLPPNKREHTKVHEKVHSYWFRDEIITDRIASKPDYTAYAA